MSGTKIKFCGMMRPEDAREAERLEADYIGVILTDSPRKVAVDEALRVFDAAPSPRKVGVVASGSVPAFATLARALALDVLQVHRGINRDEVARVRDEFDGEIWAVIPVDAVKSSIAPDWREIADLADALVFDTSVAGRSGGTGQPFNWSAAEPTIARAKLEIPVVLAGGLNPENVGGAVSVLHPTVVDVSSGVEVRPGVKDSRLMQAFANAVRSASIV